MLSLGASGLLRRLLTRAFSRQRNQKIGGWPPQAPRLTSWRRLHPDVKVFGIGLSKTGTSTLTEALNILDICCVHFPHDDQTFSQLERGEYRLSILGDYDGVTDTPVAPYYAQLDRAWPGSKFILTVRDRASWLRSADAHFRKLQGENRVGRKKRLQQYIDFVSASVYGCTYFNAERFSYAYDTHVRSVTDYFAGRPDDLLVLDICGGAEWEELCGFLGLPVPEGIPFPHANQDTPRQKDHDAGAISPESARVMKERAEELV